MKKLLSEIAVIKSGQGAPQGDSNYSNEGTPFVKAGNLKNLINGMPIDDILKVNDDVANEYKLVRFRKGTVVFAKSGMSCLKGYVYILPQDAYVVNHLACITPEEGYSKYLMYYFNFHKPNQLVKDAAYPSIRLSDISNIQLSLHDEVSRKNLVNTLDVLNEIIRKRKQELDEYDTLIKSRFVEMFGDPISNSMNWDQYNLKELTSKIGSGATPRGGKQAYKSEGISLIRSMNVHNDRFVYKDLAFIDDDQASKLSNVTIEKDDVLLNITGASVARCCVVPKEILPARVNQHVSILRCNYNLDAMFLNQQLTNESYQKYLWNIATRNGATREAITKRQVEDLKAIVPPIDKQNQYSDFVKHIDKLKFEAQNY